MTEASDYRLGTGLLSFFEVPGIQRVCVGIQIINDNIFEATEIFAISLISKSELVRVTNGKAFITIMDNDGKCKN